MSFLLKLYVKYLQPSEKVKIQGRQTLQDRQHHNKLQIFILFTLVSGGCQKRFYWYSDISYIENPALRVTKKK